MTGLPKILLGLALVGALVAFPATSAGHGGPGEARAAKLVVVNAKGVKTPRLSIAHVQHGCHVWAAGARRSASMKVLLSRGARLVIVNQDVDGHQFLQKAGARVTTPRLAMGKTGAIAFPKSGTYRLITKSLETEGMPELETDGPDYVLRLTIVVS